MLKLMLKVIENIIAATNSTILLNTIKCKVGERQSFDSSHAPLNRITQLHQVLNNRYNPISS